MLAEAIKNIEVPPGIEIPAKRADQAREWLESFRKSERLEKIAVARRLGLSDNGRNRVNKFLSGESDPGLVLAVEQLRVTVEGPEQISKFIGWRDTRCARTILAHAHRVRNGNLFGAIVGPVGAGKSEALKYFQRATRDDGLPPVRIIRCRTTMHMQGLLQTLAWEMCGIEGGSAGRLHEQVARRLSGRPEFLIIDEIDYLARHDRALELCRDLHDEVGVGVLFSGQMYFLSRVWERANNVRANIPQEEGRIGLSGPLAAFADRLRVEVAPGVADEEVVEIAQDSLKMTLTSEAAKRLVVYVNHDFRSLAGIISVMREIRAKQGRQVDHRMVEAAWTGAQHIKSKQ
jgi:hypothetical protein